MVPCPRVITYPLRKEMMTDHTKLLPRLLEKLFPLEDERELVIDIMGQYGSADFQREGDRVRMAILKLAGRSPEQIRYYTLMACRDYRDVLAGAEYPNQMGYYPWRENDPERLEQIKVKDMEQYQSWYLGILWDGKTGDP
jgi:hypothetical protein